MRKLLVIVGVFACAIAPLHAQEDPEKTLRDHPATYPFVSFFDWTQNPRRDATSGDDGPGRYNFEAGFAGSARRTAERYPDHYGPEAITSEDPFQNLADESQVAIDALGHNRPKAPYNHPTDAGHPAYMPDWNGNGVFGDGGGPNEETELDEAIALGEPGDFDADSDETKDHAFFRYPCANLDGSVWYERTDGSCAAAGQSSTAYKLGVAEELKIINSRGLVLDATVWVPGEAYSLPPTCAPDGNGNCPTNLTAPSPIPTSGASLPALIFSNGLSSRQEHYYWLAERMAREGFVVLTYDPAGQGESEGGWSDLFDQFDQTSTGTDKAIQDCQFKGACRDLQDVARWFTNEGITQVVNDLGSENDPFDPQGDAFRQELEQGFDPDDPNRQESNFAEGRYRSPFVSRKDPRYIDAAPTAGDNVHNPALAIIDTEKIGIAGNSMGALSTLNYVNYYCADGGDADDLPDHTGADGAPLPAIQAAISLSGAAITKACVPIQFQTSDYDGSPALIGPTVFALYLGNPDPTAESGEGIGYGPIKERYNILRDDADRDKDISLIVLEGGVHTDHVAVPYVTRTNWANAVAADYVANWLKCHVAVDTNACAPAMARHQKDPEFCSDTAGDPYDPEIADKHGDCDHLSRTFASEHAPDEDAPLGSTVRPSYCIKLPDRASLNMSPEDFAQAYVGDPIGEEPDPGATADCQ